MWLMLSYILMMLIVSIVTMVFECLSRIAASMDVFFFASCHNYNCLLVFSCTAAAWLVFIVVHRRSCRRVMLDEHSGWLHSALDNVDTPRWPRASPTTNNEAVHGTDGENCPRTASRWDTMLFTSCGTLRENGDRSILTSLWNGCQRWIHQSKN